MSWRASEVRFSAAGFARSVPQQDRRRWRDATLQSAPKHRWPELVWVLDNQWGLR